MQYQVIILAFRYLLASFGRGAAARPRWFYSELVNGVGTVPLRRIPAALLLRLVKLR